MEEEFYCPDCSNKLEQMSGCGSVSYFCNHCKKIISRKRILTEKEITEKIVELVVREMKDSEE